MKSVFVDDATQRVRVQGGATLGDMDRETHVFGLAVPCGIVPKTGIGGLTLGGGVGWVLVSSSRPRRLERFWAAFSSTPGKWRLT
jgi:FAD/FMN-containing dehydrogenase